MNQPSVTSMDWQSTAEGETILQYFYNPLTTGRKFFGLLERPGVPPNVEEVSYKLFVTGFAGVGKTATIARLAGIKGASVYYETPGIQKTHIYWPVKIWDKIIMFKLQFWDSGENSLKKYSHIFPACLLKADAIILVFSFADKPSFDDVPKSIANVKKTSDDPTPIVIGTRCKSCTQFEVTMSDIKEFEIKYQVPVLKIENKQASGRNEVHEVAPLLNIICERLWLRDQDYLHKQGMVHQPSGTSKENSKSKAALS